MCLIQVKEGCGALIALGELSVFSNPTSPQLFEETVGEKKLSNNQRLAGTQKEKRGGQAAITVHILPLICM